ncbi:MAG TPA: hypothetical protein PK876_06230 [Elusimicrobiota bacterium]|nr:hypothetical protein [Elusimicrobiota bacterium]
MKNIFQRRPKPPSLYRDLLAAQSGNKAAKILMYVILAMIVLGFVVIQVIPEFNGERIVFSNRSYFPSVW